MINITGKFFGALIGWFLGRLDGAIAGFLLGAIFDEFVNSRQRGNTNSNTNNANPTFENIFDNDPVDFDYILVSLSAAVMKSDGTATRSELDYVKNFFERQFGAEKTKQDLLILREALKQPIPLDRVCTMARVKMNYQTRVQLMHYLFGIAYADGIFSPQEQSVLNRIAIYLRIGPADYNAIYGMYSGVKTAPPANDRMYETLGIGRSATQDEIKKAYRQMALKYHPDRVTHLGEATRKAAEEQFKKIQEAYEAVKKDKGFS